MRNRNKTKAGNQVFWWMSVITIGVVLGTFLQFARAWVEPSSVPPGGNLGAPVNTSSNTQYKSGSLGVGGLLRGYGSVMGNRLCIGSDCRSSWPVSSSPDGYIGDSKTHYAGGSLDMNNANISDVRSLNVNYDTNTRRVYVSDDWPSSNNELASKRFVDARYRSAKSADDYIGDSQTHYAGGTLDMNNRNIIDVGDLRGDYLRGNEVYGSTVKGGWITSTGNMSAAGNFIADNVNAREYMYADGFIVSSDASLKKNILPVENSVEKIKQLTGVSFEWRKNDKESMGLIAQDVEKVFPEIVQEGEEGKKKLDYSALIAPLIQSTKEQQVKIEELEKIIKNQQKQIDSIKY